MRSNGQCCTKKYFYLYKQAIYLNNYYLYPKVEISKVQFLLN